MPRRWTVLVRCAWCTILVRDGGLIVRVEGVKCEVWCLSVGSEATHGSGLSGVDLFTLSPGQHNSLTADVQFITFDRFEGTLKL